LLCGLASLDRERLAGELRTTNTSNTTQTSSNTHHLRDEPVMTPASYDEGLKVLKMEDDETHRHHGGRARSPENSSLWGRGRVRSAGDLDVICASTYYIFSTFSHLRHCLVLFLCIQPIPVYRLYLLFVIFITNFL